MHTDDDKPPLFSNWGYWYGLIIAFLVLLIILFYLLTQKFA
jgi:hypothetical protein